MENKKEELTIEELERQREELLKQCTDIDDVLKKKKKEEKEKREAQLALKKETRKKEVDDAFDNYNKLLTAYIKDYGTYTTTTKSEDFHGFPNSFWHSFF